MVQLFRDRMRRDGAGYRTLSVWMQLIFDLVCSAFDERLEGVRMLAMLKTVFRALLLPDSTSKTARTRKQICVSLLVPSLVILPILISVSQGSIWFPTEHGLVATAFRTGSVVLIGIALLNPVVHGLVFRLRVDRDLKGALRSIVVYLPISILASTALVHSMQTLPDTGVPFLSIYLWDILTATQDGIFLCLVTVITHRVGRAPAPAPTITDHRNYWPTEIAVSLGSVAGVAIVVLEAWSNWPLY